MPTETQEICTGHRRQLSVPGELYMGAVGVRMLITGQLEGAQLVKGQEEVQADGQRWGRCEAGSVRGCAALLTLWLSLVSALSPTSARSVGNW